MHHEDHEGHEERSEFHYLIEKISLPFVVFVSFVVNMEKPGNYFPHGGNACTP